MRPLTSHLRRLALTTACLAIAAAPPAAAAGPTLGPGVHVDPTSPVAKEYSIPLSAARGGPAGGPPSATLFGRGITRSADVSSHASGAGSAAGRKSRSAAKAHHHHASSPAAPSVPLPTAAAPVPAAKVLRGGSGSGIAWMVGLAAVAIALGGAAAFGAAARGRRSEPRTS